MNIFFYAGTKSTEAEEYANLLLTTEVLQSTIVLPAGAELKSDHSLKLRNGDVMMLYAATDKDLEILLAMQDTFEAFRVILIVENQKTQILAISHMLRPRYIAFTDGDITDLEKVVSRMRAHSGDMIL